MIIQTSLPVNREPRSQIHRLTLGTALIIAIEMVCERSIAVGHGAVDDFYPNDRANLNFIEELSIDPAIAP
jgi:hypothetical protein